jgi:hypothetical protein
LSGYPSTAKAVALENPAAVNATTTLNANPRLMVHLPLFGTSRLDLAMIETVSYQPNQ